MEKRGKKNSIECDKCGNPMRSVFADMGRTYNVYACTSCSFQAKHVMK